MNPNEVGKFIKKLRQEHNLTQDQFAKRYHVTYQAVSKWETGKNMPDIALLYQICQDFNVSFEEIFGSKKETKQRKWWIVVMFIIIVGLLIFVFFRSQSNTLAFKTLSSACDDFIISGSLAYDDDHSFLHISDVSYCGKKDDSDYQTIACTLYEKDGNTKVSLSECNYQGENTIKLEQFLKDVEFELDQFSRNCQNNEKDWLYLEINATDSNNHTTHYEIPLSMKQLCSNGKER